MRRKLQPKLHCAGYTQTHKMQASTQTSLCRLHADTRTHAHTQHMPPIVHSRLKVSAMDATALPPAHLFISLYLLGPTGNADPPTSPQMRPFPPKREAENGPDYSK